MSGQYKSKLHQITVQFPPIIGMTPARLKNSPMPLQTGLSAQPPTRPSFITCLKKKCIYGKTASSVLIEENPTWDETN
jgi:hypothetical protein